MVEHQHTHSTRKLVGTQEEQMLLEDILEASKPRYPDSVVHLDYLLKTPFRYLPVNPYGSRFRRARSRKGVFYAAETLRSALAETAYYRVRFFQASESPLLPRPREQLTAFTVEYQSSRQLDLMQSPLNTDAGLWTSLETYRHTQKLADTARAAQVDSIRYQSVRDAHGGANVALMKPSAFASRVPVDRQTWYLYVSKIEVNFSRAHARGPADQWTFKRDYFEQMPEIGP